MNTFPSWETYGNYSSDNYGAHTLKFYTDGATYWFSYKTLVAFEPSLGGARVVRHNDWGPTTGKHLNWIDGGDKASRISGDAFLDYVARWSPSEAPSGV